jgi:hypothetical protein
VAQLFQHFLPPVVRVSGADHDLQVGVFIPDANNRFDSIPSGRHAHIDEGHGVRALFLQRAPDEDQTFLALESRVHLERGGR